MNTTAQIPDLHDKIAILVVDDEKLIRMTVGARFIADLRVFEEQL